MPSKNMIRKGKRRQTVKPAYRAHRDAQREALAGGEAESPFPSAASVPLQAETSVAQPVGTESSREELVIPVLGELESEDGVRSFIADAAAHGRRLDA